MCHVESVGESVRSDSSGREEDVESSSRAEVEDDIAVSQTGDCSRVAAAETREPGGLGQLGGMVVLGKPESVVVGYGSVVRRGSGGSAGVAAADVVACLIGHRALRARAGLVAGWSHGASAGRRPMMSSAAVGKQARQRSLIRHQLEVPWRSTSRKRTSPRVLR